MNYLLVVHHDAISMKLLYLPVHAWRTRVTRQAPAPRCMVPRPAMQAKERHRHRCSGYYHRVQVPAASTSTSNRNMRNASSYFLRIARLTALLHKPAVRRNTASIAHHRNFSPNIHGTPSSMNLHRSLLLDLRAYQNENRTRARLAPATGQSNSPSTTRPPVKDSKYYLK